METFRQRLKEIRIELSLKQKELGKKIGVSDACINRWENGVRTPNAENIISLCKALNCSADYLLGLNDCE